MSMTREEAIEYFKMKVFAREAIGNDIGADYEAYKIALTALHPVSREQVERVWRGEWIHTHSSVNFWTEVWKCSHCGFEDDYGECFDFCPFCGRAMTDEAVQMVMERMEALHETT